MDRKTKNACHKTPCLRQKAEDLGRRNYIKKRGFKAYVHVENNKCWLLPFNSFISKKDEVKRKMFSGALNSIFDRARQLRSQQTFTEEILWNFLRTRPLGLKFRRQHPYSNYILDFYCHSIKVVIEVDGSIHQLEEVKRNDAVRQKYLEEEEGLSFLRFPNEKIKIQPEEVFKQIETFLQAKIEEKKTVL